MADHQNAAQLHKEALAKADDLNQRLRGMNFRQQSVQFVVSLAEHIDVQDPVALAERIYRFIAEGTS